MSTAGIDKRLLSAGKGDRRSRMRLPLVGSAGLQENMLQTVIYVERYHVLFLRFSAVTV